MRNLPIFALLLLLVGCDTASQSVETINFLNRTDAAQVRVETSGTAVFKSAEEWETFWIENHENLYQRRPIPPVPVVDFERRMLVAVFLGPVSGCATNTTPVEIVDQVEQTGDILSVEVGPRPGFGACRAFSWPLQVIEVPKVNGEVSFVGFDSAGQ